jgi:cytochrome P450
MHLARLESTKIFNALLDELPGLRLDPDAPPPYVTGVMFRSPPRLDVVWD